jgi:hypothetical protein
MLSPGMTALDGQRSARIYGGRFKNESDKFDPTLIAFMHATPVL